MLFTVAAPSASADSRTLVVAFPFETSVWADHSPGAPWLEREPGASVCSDFLFWIRNDIPELTFDDGESSMVAGLYATGWVEFQGVCEIEGTAAEASGTVGMVDIELSGRAQLYRGEVAEAVWVTLQEAALTGTYERTANSFDVEVEVRLVAEDLTTGDPGTELLDETMTATLSVTCGGVDPLSSNGSDDMCTLVTARSVG